MGSGFTNVEINGGFKGIDEIVSAQEQREMISK